MLLIPLMRTFILRHRFITAMIILVSLVAAYGGYSMYAGSEDDTRYILGIVTKGTIIASVSGSGQVSASDEVDVKPKVSGDVVSIPVKPGQAVKRGQTIAVIDSTEAQQTVINARLDLAEAKLTLERDTSQAPIDFQQTKDALSDAEEDLAAEYDAVYTAVSDAYVTLPGIMSEADDLLYDTDISVSAQNVNAYQNLFISSDDATQRSIKSSASRAVDDYVAARDAYSAAYAHFKDLSRGAPPEDLEEMLAETERLVKLVSQALTSEVNLIDAVVDQIARRDWTAPSGIAQQQSSAHAELSSANSVLTDVAAQAQDLRDAKKSVTTARQDLEIASIGNPEGDNPFDLQLKRNDVAKSEAALRSAELTLADHVVRAPFDGVVASIAINAHDSLSTGTVIATLITDKQVATFSLNEVDAIAVTLGDTATLTFDALDDLILTGAVVEIDTTGTVAQSVVSYGVEIALDTQDEGVRPGMTVNATIVTDTRKDVLTVPSSAVKTQGDRSYVLAFDPEIPNASPEGVSSVTEPVRVVVTTGASDDTSVEILSGLEEGQQIVTRTTGSAAPASASGGFRGPGGGIRL